MGCGVQECRFETFCKSNFVTDTNTFIRIQSVNCSNECVTLAWIGNIFSGSAVETPTLLALEPVATTRQPVSLNQQVNQQKVPKHQLETAPPVEALSGVSHVLR